MKKTKYLSILILLLSIFVPTYAVFTDGTTLNGSIQTKELSAVFLDNNDFLAKIQVLDSSITSIDKTTDLNQVTTIPTVTLTSDNLVSTTTSSMPIYAWVDNNTIYYYTGATNIDLNNN